MKKRLYLSYLLFLAPIINWSQSIDSSSIKQIDSLISLSRELTENEEFEKALALNITAEKIALNNLGKQTASYASTCYNHGRVLYVKGDFKESEKWYLESLSIREQVLGKESLDYTKSLHNLALLYSALGDYKKSLAYNLESKEIRFRIIGMEHEYYAQTIHNIAGNYWDLEQYPQAEEAYLEAISIRKKILGKEHSDYLYSLGNLANLYVIMNRFESAEPLFIESLELHEKMYGKNSSRYGSMLNNLAVFYDEQLHFDQAERYYKLARENIFKNKGKLCETYALIDNNLATLYLTTGRYEEAEKLYLEGIEIRRKVNSKSNDKEYLRMKANLGALYLLMYNYDKAEKYFKEVLAIEQHDDLNTEYAINLGHLAAILLHKRKLDEAEKMYITAKDIIEKIHGKNHIRYAKCLTNFAMLYANMKNYQHAESYLLESKEIFLKILGKNSFDYAKCLSLISNLYYLKGDFALALSLIKESRFLMEETVGMHHPYLMEVYDKQIKILYQLKQTDEIEKAFIDLFNLTNRLLESSIHFLSDQELSAFKSHIEDNQNLLFSFNSQFAGKNSARLCFDQCLLFKGFLLNVAQHLRQNMESDSTLNHANQLIKSYHQRIIREYSKPDEHRNSITELQNKIDSLEKDIVNRMPDSKRLLSKVNSRDIQKKLKEGDAVIEFVRYTFTIANRLDSIMYVAMILQSGEASPKIVPLCEQRQLDSLLQKSTVSDQYYINSLYNNQNNTSLNTLYHLVWKPLESHLKKVKKIYYTPDGNLYRINFSSIKYNDSNYTVGEKYQLILLGSSRQLADSLINKKPNREIVVYGDIQYNLDTTQLKSQFESIDSTFALTEDKSGLFKFVERNTLNSGMRGLVSGEWQSLKYSQSELKNLKRYIESKQYIIREFTGPNASEESFKQIGFNSPSPQILHISTHGYFFPELQKEDNHTDIKMDREPFKRISDQVLLRSGLILAGANYAWKYMEPHGDREDGILTSKEIALLDLTHTNLVVLSACETGLGDIQGSEGVYGLQRAFKIAGVKNIVMSLWQVDDEATSLLMQEFYKNLLFNKKSIRDALTTAQSMLRNSKKFSSPYFWGGWVLLE